MSATRPLFSEHVFGALAYAFAGVVWRIVEGVRPVYLVDGGDGIVVLRAWSHSG